jgi:glycerol-3-phosphate dehydrogenase (NAD(P)+)
VTLASLLARSGHKVTLVCRTAEEVSAVDERRGLARMPEILLPPAVTMATAVTDDVEGIVVAVPAQALRATLAAPNLPRGVPLLCASKGIEHASGRLLPAVIADLGWPEALIGILSGPNLAHEVARGLPAASVVAAPGGLAATWQHAFSTPTFRVYRSTDVTGVALGGALKNVVAIAAGAAAGLDYGTNAVATILTRGLAEMLRLGLAMGADPLTFQGLAGVGDLAATCFSPLSRNHRFGRLIATGLTPGEAIAEIGETVEGAATAPVALRLAAANGVELPLCAGVAAVIEGTIAVADAAAMLLGRPPAAEAHSVP